MTRSPIIERHIGRFHLRQNPVLIAQLVAMKQREEGEIVRASSSNSQR